MSEELKPPHPIARADGSEGFDGIDATVADFWRWAFSDLRMNNVRGILAEFLVAKAVGAVDTPKEEWANFDVQTPDGVRIEVKASAHWQSWPQRAPSKIIFSGLTARTWQDDGSYSKDRQVRADVFVFAVQACADPTKYDPLDVSQWAFYVLPASTVAASGTRSLSLAALAGLKAGPVAWPALATAVATAAA